MMAMGHVRARWVRPLLVLAALAACPSGWAQETAAVAATNPASDALNRTADAVAAAQGTPGMLSREYPRVSQIIGASLYGTGNEMLGEIVDVVLRDQAPLAIVRPGRDGSLVSVPITDVRWLERRLVLPGVTAQGLRSRPPFRLDAAGG